MSHNEFELVRTKYYDFRSSLFPGAQCGNSAQTRTMTSKIGTESIDGRKA